MRARVCMSPYVWISLSISCYHDNQFCSFAIRPISSNSCWQTRRYWPLPCRPIENEDHAQVNINSIISYFPLRHFERTKNDIEQMGITIPVVVDGSEKSTKHFYSNKKLYSLNILLHLLQSLILAAFEHFIAFSLHNERFGGCGAVQLKNYRPNQRIFV